jgi:hypothetical protein
MGGLCRGGCSAEYAEKSYFSAYSADLLVSNLGNSVAKHFLFGALDEEAREKVLENKTTIIIRPVGGSRH